MLGFDLRGEWHFAVLIRIVQNERDEETYYDRLHTLGMLQDYFSSLDCMNNMEIHSADTDLTAIICHSSSPWDAFAIQSIPGCEELLEEINGELPGEVLVSVGGFHKGLGELGDSYSEAFRVLNYWLPFESASLGCFDIMTDNPCRSLYDEKDSTKLVQLVLLDKTDEYRKCLAGIFKRMEKGDLEGREGLIKGLGGTMEILLSRLPADEEQALVRLNRIYKHMDSISDSNQWERGIFDFFDLCSLINLNRKRSRNYDLRDRIICDLESNYSDSNICLALYAQKYGITEQYLSQFIKEQTGLGFAAYLEKVRMDSIVNELADTPDPITRISLRNGYANKNTFYKAFKRRYGISPREFRNGKTEIS